MAPINPSANSSSSSPRSVREQLQDSARGLWSSVMPKGPSTITPVSPDGSSNDQQESQGQQVSLESVIRVMFGSCTTGANSADEEQDCMTSRTGMERPDGSGSDKRSKSTPPSPSPIKGDRLYRQLFPDNHMRAEEAVVHLREQLEQKHTARSPPRPTKDVPGMFPASSPKYRSPQIPSLPNAPPSTIDPTKNSNKNDQPLNARSFDDGISIITQITLEDLANNFDPEDFLRVHSDVTQDPIEEVEESWKETAQPRGPQTPSPFRRRTKKSPLGFGQSNRSQDTTHTKGTKGTKSTMSTQTNEFANAWQKEERKYWEDVVKEQGVSNTSTNDNRHKKLMKAREISHRMRRHSEHSCEDSLLKRDGTMTTVHSTVYSGRSSYQDRSVSATQRDPDRLMEVLIMPPGTEMAEI